MPAPGSPVANEGDRRLMAGFVSLKRKEHCIVLCKVVKKAVVSLCSLAVKCSEVNYSFVTDAS